tara:strand:- start:375 stop:890 length:516 start_codon:yes stop_codon:yes gene_type:complete
MANILSSLGSAVATKLGEKLSLEGGTMTGALVIQDPAASNHAATSGQVENLESKIGSYASYVATFADVTVTVDDTQANILARTGDPKGAVAVASDTSNIYVWNGSSWVASDIDSVRDDFLTISATLNISGDTESNVVATDSPSTGEIMYGTDTDDLYVYSGSEWHFYNNDA